MYSIIRPLLFRLDPEQAHHLTLQLLRLLGAVPVLNGAVRRLYAGPGSKPVEAFGLTFPNAVGLAAGYDKDGLGWRGLGALGFGHIEVGTVTPRPQAGNPRPRLFRLPAEKSLINRMGFPGLGADFVEGRLAGPRPPGLILGVNLGKNKDTPLEEAASDYELLLERFAPLADYLVVNVSSPNTVGLRRLQARQALDALLSRLAARRAEQAARLGRQVPLLVKLAPDLAEAELADSLDVIQLHGLDGVIATNTTISREGLHSPLAVESGGLSGAALTARSTAMIASIRRLTAGALPVIGVGGIMNAADAREKLEAGAVLVQVYSGLVYRGPSLVREILRGI